MFNVQHSFSIVHYLFPPISFKLRIIQINILNIFKAPKNSNKIKYVTGWTTCQVLQEQTN